MEVYKDGRMQIEDIMVVMYNLDMSSCVVSRDYYTLIGSAGIIMRCGR